jgi:hypothetical protein
MFINHVERFNDTPNADTSIKNYRLIGDVNLVKNVQEYISDCKFIKVDNTLGREMLLTASKEYFDNISKEEFLSWVYTNVKWLVDKFKDMVLYAILHLDETSPHIHAFISPKRWLERGYHLLSNRHFFGNKQKLSELQDDYAKTITERFPSLKRGIKKSRAKHIDIKKYYGLLDNEVTQESAQTLHKNNILLKHRIKGLENTLKVYERDIENYKTKALEADKRVLELSKEIKELRKENKLYRGVCKIPLEKLKDREMER